MSAHCNDCGSDLSYVLGDWPAMFCRECKFRDALRDILDFTTGWTRSMPVEERIAGIEKIAQEALA